MLLRLLRLPAVAPWLLSAGLLLGMVGCSSPAKVAPLQEHFGSGDTYSRLFDAPPEHTCEAARRALLSQGYVIGAAAKEQIEGRKNFQPSGESHLEITIRVVCAPDSPDSKLSLAFVSANQDHYALKKANSSASLGVSALGSVSLPFMSSSDSLVKVGSETINSVTFYDSFFDLVKRYLSDDETATP